MLASTNEHFLSTIRSKIRTVHALDAQKALQCLEDANLKGVVVADDGIYDDENSAVLSSLIGWVNAGGIAVIGCLFTAFILWSKIDQFFEEWGLSWTMDAYTRENLVLNHSNRLSSSHSANLTTSYCMKAIYLKGVKDEDVLYAPEEYEDDEEYHVSPPPLINLPHVSVAYTQIGDGFLGYIGDVNSGEETTSVILAMLRL